MIVSIPCPGKKSMATPAMIKTNPKIFFIMIAIPCIKGGIVLPGVLLSFGMGEVVRWDMYNDPWDQEDGEREGDDRDDCRGQHLFSPLIGLSW